jgi:hypothetical protein
VSGITPGLRGLLSRLQAYRVDWKFSFVPTEDKEYEPGTDREVAELNEANVVSSTRLDFPKDHVFDPEMTEVRVVPRHAVLLDIDYPAHLVESSSPGHYHLYLDVPNGVKHDDYMELLAMLAKCGVIEKGYADVSIARGHSDLRLPWVSKDDQKLHTEGAPAPAPTDVQPF